MSNRAPRFADFFAVKDSPEVSLARIGWLTGTSGKPPRDSDLFKLLDIKCDGGIDRQELKIGLTRLRKGFIDDKELDSVFATYCKSGSESLSADEFSAFVLGASSNHPDPLEAELLLSSDGPLPPSAPRSSATARRPSLALGSNQYRPVEAPTAQSSVGEELEVPAKALRSPLDSKLSQSRAPSRPVIRGFAAPNPDATLQGVDDEEGSRRIEADVGQQQNTDTDSLAFGISPEAWTSVRAQYGASFPSSELSIVLSETGCGFRASGAFTTLLCLRLDPRHAGMISFKDFQRWLHESMEVVRQATDAVAPGRGADERTRLLVSAVEACASAPPPALDHPAIDVCVHAAARLRMYTPPHTPLAKMLSGVLVKRGSLPTSIIGKEVQTILDRYETKGDGIVSTESLERLLNDLDFYIPAPSGSEAAEALRSAYIAKLDFFEEALPGVNISALQVWWADLQLVIGALDAALSAIVGDEAQKIHDDMASNIRRLVGAIQRANACTAPLSHRMVDEALVVLYRFGDAAKAGRLPPLSLQSQTEQLGPSSTAILGIGFLGGLLAIDELISIHVAPGKKYDTDSLAKILHDCGFHDCVKASVLQEIGAFFLSRPIDSLRQSLTSARLRLERLQALLLQAVCSSVANAISPPPIRDDSELSELLVMALDFRLVSNSTIPLGDNVLVVESRNILVSRLAPSSQLPGLAPSSQLPVQPALVPSPQVHDGADSPRAPTVDDDFSSAVWRKVNSTTVPNQYYWYNKVTGESRWTPPS